MLVGESAVLPLKIYVAPQLTEELTPLFGIQGLFCVLLPLPTSLPPPAVSSSSGSGLILQYSWRTLTLPSFLPCLPPKRLSLHLYCATMESLWLPDHVIFDLELFQQESTSNSSRKRELKDNVAAGLCPSG